VIRRRYGTPARHPAIVRLLPVLAMLALAGCTEATASRVGDRTFRIEGPGLPVESTQPNRRIAERLCPKGYRVVDQITRRNTPDGIRDEDGMFTNWTIRCI
jgi:hypothetical protein